MPSDNSSNNSPATTPATSPVTYERVAASLASYSIELTPTHINSVGHAVINGCQVFVGVVGRSSVFVRADESFAALAQRKPITADKDAAFWFPRCNQVCAQIPGMKALPLITKELQLLRTEMEAPITAGMNDDQLGETVNWLIYQTLYAQAALTDVGE